MDILGDGIHLDRKRHSLLDGPLSTSWRAQEPLVLAPQAYLRRLQWLMADGNSLALVTGCCKASPSIRTIHTASPNLILTPNLPDRYILPRTHRTHITFDEEVLVGVLFRNQINKHAKKKERKNQKIIKGSE